MTIAPDTTKETSVPGIPEPRPENLLAVVKAIKEVLEVREGRIGDPLDQAVTYRELFVMGKLDVSAQNHKVYARLPGAGLVFLDINKSATPEYNPPPAPTGFVVTGALASMLLSWDRATYHGHSYTEVWRAAVDNLGLAVLIGTTDSFLYADKLGTTGVTRFYWIRHVSRTGVQGKFNATAGTSGTAGLVDTGDIAADAITTTELADGSVVTAKLGDAAVTTTKIGDSQVSTAKINDAAVTTTKIGDTAVTEAKIGNLAVTTTKLADGSVVTGKIGDLQITTQKIADGNITELKLGASSVTESKIGTSAVTEAKIGTSAVTSTKLGDGSVIEAKIGNLAVTSTKLADGSITVEKHGTGLRPVQVVASLPALPNSLYPLDEAVVFLSTDGKLYRNSSSAAGSVVESGTAQAGSSNTLTLRAGASAVNDAFNAMTARLVSGAGSVQERKVTAYDGSTKVATVSPRWRTQYCKWSGDFTNVVWVISNPANIVTPNSADVAAPDGSLTACKVEFTTNDGNRSFGQSTTAAAAGRTDILSCWVYVPSANTGTNDRFYMFASGDIPGDGVLLNSLPRDQWVLVEYAHTWAGGVSGNIKADLHGNHETSVGNIYYYWKPQLEIGVGTVGEYIEAQASATTLPDATTGYEVHGGAWTAEVPTADLTGQITETQITDSAISTPKLAANAVTAAKIAANTITANEIAANTITAGQIAAAAITADELAANAVVAGKIAAGTIVAADIAAATITGAKIAGLTIEAGNIAADAIVAAKIAAGAIVAGKIATNAIVADDGVIANAAIKTALIADAAITNAKIGLLAVDTANIADAAIVEAKIADATITTAKIGDAQITTAKIASAAITTALIGDAQITNAKIGLLAVGAANIADLAVTAAKIDDATITTAKIANAQITDALIANATITGGKIAASTITADKLSVSQLSALSADMGSLTAGTIALASSGHIRAGQTGFNAGTGFFLGFDGATPKFSVGNSSGTNMRWDGTTITINGDVVATGNIKTNAVSNQQVTVAGPQTMSGLPKTIASRSITTSGNFPVMVAASFGSTGNVRFSIKRGTTTLHTFPQSGFNGAQACVSATIVDTPGTGAFTYNLVIEAVFSGAPTADPIVLVCTELKR